MKTAYEKANRLEGATARAFAKFPQGKALDRAEALAFRAREARKVAQGLFAKENPCTVWPNFLHA